MIDGDVLSIKIGLKTSQGKEIGRAKELKLVN
jgi:hypothetical protein